jgi:ABC-type Fe3+ transport system substrate-binding protein
MPKTVPHPNAAKLFLDYLISKEAVLLYSDLHQTPLFDAELAKKAKTNLALKDGGIEALPLPEEFQTTENLTKSSKFWLETLGVTRGQR